MPARSRCPRVTAATAARFVVVARAEELGGEHHGNDATRQCPLERAGQPVLVRGENHHRLAEHRRVTRPVRVGVVAADGVGRGGGNAAGQKCGHVQLLPNRQVVADDDGDLGEVHRRRAGHAVTILYGDQLICHNRRSYPNRGFITDSAEYNSGDRA